MALLWRTVSPAVARFISVCSTTQAVTILFDSGPDSDFMNNPSRWGMPHKCGGGFLGHATLFPGPPRRSRAVLRPAEADRSRMPGGLFAPSAGQNGRFWGFDGRPESAGEENPEWFPILVRLLPMV
jgi:hypothetical protein